MSDLPSVASISRMSQKELRQIIDNPRDVPQIRSHIGKEVLVWLKGLTREHAAPAKIVRSDVYPSWRGLGPPENVLFFETETGGIVSNVEYSWAFR